MLLLGQGFVPSPRRRTVQVTLPASGTGAKAKLAPRRDRFIRFTRHRAAREPGGRGGVRREHPELEPGPVHERRGLRHGNLRNGRSVAHEHDDRNRAGVDPVPSGRERPPGLVVDPAPGGRYTSRLWRRPPAAGPPGCRCRTDTRPPPPTIRHPRGTRRTARAASAARGPMSPGPGRRLRHQPVAHLYARRNASVKASPNSQGSRGGNPWLRLCEVSRPNGSHRA